MTKKREIDWEQPDSSVNENRANWRGKKGAELRERLIFLLDDLAPSRGKYAYLENRTGISAASWQNLYLEKQMPTLDMILAVFEYRYPYLNWLITGQAPGTEQMPMAPSSEEWEKFQTHRAWVRTSKKKG